MDPSNTAADIIRTRIDICIATFKRPDGLRALVESLDRQRIPDNVDLRLVIVDNDGASPLGAPPPSRFETIYVVEPLRGIAAARNAALDLVGPDTDFVVFVDDDEVVEENWLAALLAVQRRTGAAAVQGSVVPRYAATPPKWMDQSGVFRLGPYQDGASIDFAATNNVIVEVRWIRQTNLRFDSRFNTTGGSDHEFFQRLQVAGGKIVTAGSAVVIDEIPVHRTTLNWVVRRQFRKGNTLARIAVLHRRGVGVRAARGFGKVVKGAVIALARLAIGRHPGPGVLHMAFGAGTLAGIGGIGYEEYGEKGIAADRANKS